MSPIEKIQIKALPYLRKKDPVIKRLIATYPRPRWDGESDLFADLVEAIVQQQLSEKAGATIFDRFKKLFRDVPFPKPQDILKIPDDKIRSCGISFAKITYIKGLSALVAKGDLDLKNLSKLPDEEVLEELIKVKGIGRWTAEMTLMFSLKRPDVFSLGDLGLRTAVSKLYGTGRDDLKKIETISNAWKPYRTIASRYLWKSLNNQP